MFCCFDPDGLNQLSTVNGTSAAYDARGNMTTDPATARTYSYLKTNNQLATVTSPFTSFSYDALDRLWKMETPTVTNYVTDGADTIAEYDSSNVLQKRYAFDGTGWPLVQYDAAGNRTWMLPDERGSIVALANDSAAMTAINTYDEYGVPGAGNAGTFQYASMMWLSRAGVYAPSFRAYGAHLGRFNQTDPIGMAGGINLYAYVGNDPVNRADPLGLFSVCRLAGAGAPDQLNWWVQCYENGVNVSSQEPGRGNRGERSDVGEKGDRAQKSQGKPNKCLTQRYRLGKDIDDLGRFLQRATVIGGGFVALMSVPEGGFVPTAVAAIRVYAYASAVRTLGTALMSDPHQGIQEVVTRGLGRMASADPIGEWIAGEVLGLVAKQVEGPNPCNG